MSHRQALDASGKAPPVLFKGKTVTSEHQAYQVTRRLGEGQFAEVWEVKSGELRYALKIEKVPERQQVKHELKVLSQLPSGCEQVVRKLDQGLYGQHPFFIMELLGESLFDVRRGAPGGRLDLPSVKAIALSTLAALESFHGAGFIHRDIKPANYVISPPNAAPSRGKWVLIDFNLARRWRDKEPGGGHVSARAQAEFRGSTTYASVHAHRQEDLSRRDDLWSWFYMVLELVEGGLLWRSERDEPRDHARTKDWVLQEKQRCMDDPRLLSRNPLPEPLLALHAHIKALGFYDSPDYAALRTCLAQLPDHMVELQLHSLLPPPQQQLKQQQQQQWQVNGLQQQQQQPHQAAWAQSPNADWQHDAYQQQQQQCLMGRDSPGMNGSIQAGSGIKRQHTEAQEGAAAAGGGGKRRQQEHAAAQQQTWPEQQQQQHVSGPGSSSASPGDGDDTIVQPGSLLFPPQSSTAQHTAAAAANGREHHETAAAAAAAAAMVSGGTPEAAPPEAEGMPQHQLQHLQVVGVGDTAHQQQAAAGSTAAHAAAAAAAAAAAGTPAAQPGVAVGGAAAGRAAEIAELLVVYEQQAPEPSRASTQAAVSGLCGLGPLEAVAAIGLTLQRLVSQSDASCLPAVSQLLLDLAAYTAHAANEAARAAGQQQQRGVDDATVQYTQQQQQQQQQVCQQVQAQR